MSDAGNLDNNFCVCSPEFPESRTFSEVLDHLCQVEGRYDIEEKVLYINLVGPWNAMHLNVVWQQIIQDMKELGFLHCWNVHTNICARALLFVFTMSHIVVIDHPSHTPDFPTLQLLKLLSFIRPKYQVLQTNLLTNVMYARMRWELFLSCPAPTLFS